MRIISEKLDEENYIDVLITSKELKAILDNHVLAKMIMIENDIYNIGIILTDDIEGESDL